MKVTLVALTKPFVDPVITTAEDLIVYCARVSSPQNQLNTETTPRLLRYCIKNRHWSIFEQASMTVEIQTSRAIAQQILRHRSFSFQEFSQRYATVKSGCEEVELRAKGSNNRQGSLFAIEPDALLNVIVKDALKAAETVYEELLASGIAPECARFVLPLATKTTLYMTGTIRSWIHYLEQRTSEHAQKEHRAIALEIKSIFDCWFPNIAEALKSPVTPEPNA